MDGDEEDIQITWRNSKSTETLGTGRQLSVNSQLDASESSYLAEYWCSATNSGGTGRSQNVTVHIISQDFNEFCFEDTDSGYTWEKTAVLSKRVKSCPPGKTGTVSRLCKRVDGKPVWDEVDSSDCRSTAIIQIVDRVDRLTSGFQTDNVSTILQETEEATQDDDLYENDVKDVVYVLEKVQEETKTPEDSKNFLKSSSNIVDKKKEKAWNQVDKKNTLARSLVSATDLTAQTLISQSPESEDIVEYSTPNIDVVGVNLPTVRPIVKALNLLFSGEGIKVPAVVSGGIRQASVVIYNTLQDILSQKQLQSNVEDSLSTSNLALKSTVVSFSTNPKLNDTVPEPFKVVLQNNQTGFSNPKRTCAFVEPSDPQSKWSTAGCTLNEKESDEVNVTCDCDHNTAFAILMDVTGVQLTETERKTLEMISTVGCSISLLGVVLTILMQACFWKQLKSPRSKVLLSLCVAIGFTDIFAILEGVARDNSALCTAVAALLHFFVLAAFGWMLCEGILLYILLIRVFDGVRGRHWKIFNLIGWGAPALIVGISLGATQADGYGTETSCWLSVESKLIWAFVGPAFFVILANTVVFIMVLRTMMNSHKVKQEDAIGKVKTGVKASVVIFPILGLTWVFGLMTFNRDTLFFRYLFAVFNSSQGMFIFLFHCVLNKQMRDVVRNSTMRRSTFSTSFGKKTIRRQGKSKLVSTPKSSPAKTLGANINQAMAEKNGRFSSEYADWKSSSYTQANDNSVSQAEEMRELESPKKDKGSPVSVTFKDDAQGNELAGPSSSSASMRSRMSAARDPEVGESESRGYGSEESENVSSERPSGIEEARVSQA